MCSRTLNRSWNFFTPDVAAAWVLHWATYRDGVSEGGIGQKPWRKENKKAGFGDGGRAGRLTAIDTQRQQEETAIWSHIG